MTLGEKIRKRREELNLSQTALGQKVWPRSGAPNAGTRIRRFEAGQKPKVHEIKLLAEALELESKSAGNHCHCFVDTNYRWLLRMEKI